MISGAPATPVRFRTDVSELTAGQLVGFFEGWHDPPDSQVHLRILEQASHRVVAMAGQRVVGFITAVSDGVLSAYVPLLEVLPDFRGQGIGKELVHRMLAQLSGIYMIDLVCDAELRTFYERAGFRSAHAMIQRNFKYQSGKA